MEINNLQARKDGLMDYFSKIIKEIDGYGNCSIYYNNFSLTVNKNCKEKGYKIKPGEFIVNKETGELFLFLGIGELNTNALYHFPWILREGKFFPTLLSDDDLTIKFDQKYCKV